MASAGLLSNTIPVCAMQRPQLPSIFAQPSGLKSIVIYTKVFGNIATSVFIGTFLQVERLILDSDEELCTRVPAGCRASW
jgi:hypothetical protein